MRRFPLVSVPAALLTAILLFFLAGCGGNTAANTTVVSIVLTPATLSLNEGAVGSLSASAENSAGNVVAADITFTSSNNGIATVSSAGLVCGGVWDANFINCNATIGQEGVGQVTITATSGKITATSTVYVHLKVDRVVANQLSGCFSMGQMIPATASAYNTSAPGCSQSAPCDITSTVGPIAFGSNDLTVASNSSGIDPTYSAATQSPTYSSGGTITGSKGQTCNLSNFGVGGSSGINPTYSPVTNSPTYTTGGIITGSTGQTCGLSNFNGVTGATATVVLTGTNVIAPGTHLMITSEGSGGTTPPTTATLSNGTANCSGTATVITALTGVSGIGQGVVDAMATVTLTGMNTIASGTALTVTASGFGATTPPTTATLSNGTATCSGVANVITQLSGTGVFTAENPGSTTIFGSVSGVNSVGVPYLTCPAVYILVHDATSQNTSFTLSKGGTQMLTADVYDSAGQYIKPALTWASSSPASATVATGTSGNNPATITAVAPGTASITASCSYPNCNNSIPNAPLGYSVFPQYSLNVVTAWVTGATATSVFAASTNSTTVTSINTTTNAVGLSVTLPNLPNSILVDPVGNNLYLGSSSGIMGINLSTNLLTTYPVNGAVVAISPNSQFLLVSDSVSNNVYYLDISSSTVTYTSPGATTSSSAYTPDSKFNEWVSGTQLVSGLPTGVQIGLPGNGMLPLPYTTSAIGISAQGGLSYITGSSPGQVDVRSTCDQSEVQSLSANAPTLIGAVPNATGAVAADSPSVDVVSTPGTLTQSPYPSCSVTTPSTSNSFNMGVGDFTARQLFFSSDSSRAWIINDLPELIYFNLQSSVPVVIPYAGGATAYSGGITLDGSQVYVGASDFTVHRIDVASSTDAQQIAISLKDANGNPVVPNLVAVQPH
jgi:hypothetical protein